MSNLEFYESLGLMDSGASDAEIVVQLKEWAFDREYLLGTGLRASTSPYRAYCDYELFGEDLGSSIPYETGISELDATIKVCKILHEKM